MTDGNEKRDKLVQEKGQEHLSGYYGLLKSIRGGKVFSCRCATKASADYRTHRDTERLRAVNAGTTNIEFIAH